jgi:hypothetical protein
LQIRTNKKNYIQVEKTSGLNLIKKTRPEAHPIELVCLLIIEDGGGYSGGI